MNFGANRTNPSEFQCAGFSFVQKITIDGCVIIVDKAEYTFINFFHFV